MRRTDDARGIAHHARAVDIETASPVPSHMHIMHVALGGCLTSPPVSYGITQDTGGHIAYVLGAAAAQAASDPSVRVSIVTRAFDEPALGGDHAETHQPLGERLCIRRLRTACSRYLTKSALAAELPALRHAFLALLAEDMPDVVHAHFADAAELALAAKRRFGLPVIYTPHSLSLDKRRRAGPLDEGELSPRARRERRAIAACDAIVASSEDEVHRQIGAYDPSAPARCHVVRPGVHLQPSTGTALARALVDPFLDDPDKPVVLAIARPVPKKNLPRLLDAYGRCARLRREANLVLIAGQHERIRGERDEQTQELDRLHALVARHGLGGQVAMPPAHAPETVTQLYRLAARRGGLFVNPACHEPFGLTLIEAASFGLPVVATRRGGPRDIVATLGHGRLVDPYDRDAIAAGCRALLGDAHAYAEASRAGLRNSRLYSWDRWAASVGEILASVVSSGSASIRPAPAGSAAIRVAAARTSGVRTPSRFLAFDIDDTLTGCARGAARFRHWIDNRAAKALPYALATGRELPDAIDVVRRWHLPWPDVWLTSVGTEIWRPSADGGLARCRRWERWLSAGWDRGEVLRHLSGLDLPHQSERTQRPWKVSLFGTAGDAAALSARFAGERLDVRVIASHGRFIDIVPGRGGKAAAIEFEARSRGVPLSRCIAAGNSGNDADMLDRCGQAILVANALAEVSSLAERPGLYRSSAPYAHGVLEGLTAFATEARAAPSSGSTAGSML